MPRGGGFRASDFVILSSFVIRHSSFRLLDFRVNSCAGQPTTEAPLLAARNVSKFFPGVRALDGIDFTLRRGEVHALMGENGAGKSTLIKVLTGVYRRDEGEILLEGRSAVRHQYRLSRGQSDPISLGGGEHFSRPPADEVGPN